MDCHTVTAYIRAYGHIGVISLALLFYDVLLTE